MGNGQVNLNHALGEDVDALRDTVRSFCEKHVGPHAAEIDRTSFRATCGPSSVRSACTASR